MKKCIRVVVLVVLVMSLFGCQKTDREASLTIDQSADTAKKSGEPKAIEEFTVEESELYTYQGKDYYIKDDTLYCKEGKDTKEISLMGDKKNDTENGKTYIRGNAFFLNQFLFYNYSECIQHEIENGAWNEWGEDVLYRINLETGRIDQSFQLEKSGEENAKNDTADYFTVLGADSQNGYLYLNKENEIYVLDLSFKEIDRKVVGSKGRIQEIFWKDDGYVFTEDEIFKMSMLLEEGARLQTPKKICDWPETVEGDAYVEAIGTYGRFLYGYTYYHGTRGAVGGHYFQIDIDGKSCKNLSTYDSEYEADTSFETDSFASKHELYSEDRCYVLSEDGEVKIETKKQHTK